MAGDGRTRARPGSFVYYSARTPADLVDQVNNNPTVGRRYSNHFGVSRAKLAEYFANNLKVITLTRPTKVTTYFVSKYGRVMSKQRTLPAGRQVFAAPGNKLLMEVGCGNPLTKQMPQVKTQVKPSVETVAAPPVVETLPEEIVAPMIEETPEVVAQLPPVVEAVLPPIEAFSSGPSILDFVEVLGPVVAGLQYVQASKDDVPYVPEPGSLATVALASIGLTGYVLTGRKRARK